MTEFIDFFYNSTRREIADIIEFIFSFIASFFQVVIDSFLYVLSDNSNSFSFMGRSVFSVFDSFFVFDFSLNFIYFIIGLLAFVFAIRFILKIYDFVSNIL